jgi:hypothetical protein
MVPPEAGARASTSSLRALAKQSRRQGRMDCFRLRQTATADRSSQGLLAMTSMTMLRLPPSYPAKAGYPVRRELSALSQTPRNTGSSAFADDDEPGHSRDGIRPSFANSFTPKNRGRSATLERGRGEDRVRAAPAVSCAKMHTAKSAHEHTGSAEAVRPSLRNGLRLISCSPRRDQSLFVTVASVMRSIIANLTPAIGASGPHDFAVRVSHARQSQLSRPSHPDPRFVTNAHTPLWWDGMRKK